MTKRMYPSESKVSFAAKGGGLILDLGGTVVEAVLARHRLAKSFKASYREGILKITAPSRATRAEITAAIQRMAPELLAYYEKAQAKDHEHRTSPISHLGHELELDVQPSRSRLWASLAGQKLSIGCEPGDADLLVAAWMVQRAEELLPGMVKEEAARMGVNPARTTIKDGSSRWGSCSTKGAINLNWRLVMAPEPIIRYLVIHELAHLKEMNHSDRFWNVVADACPDYKALDRWLTKEGKRLMARFPRISIPWARSRRFGPPPN